MRPRSGRQAGHEGGGELVGKDNGDGIGASGPWKRLHLLKVSKSATKRENWPARPSCPQRTYFGSLPLLGHHRSRRTVCLHLWQKHRGRTSLFFQLLQIGISGCGEERVGLSSGFRKLALVEIWKNYFTSTMN
ncbi:uncharacterized protein TNIN_357991 [Trichonephila inaurata madagascariensis]|uniref:Uncharacterized protein n=1 Tax=Trichonephila inaurata madagascariensis TaxID=2747483 RepID=A0A8X6MIZ4_9ARAC|nr:uncharacterized protein TNIN_357991 [Trichonephila inaurata madagascariensis]